MNMDKQVVDKDLLFVAIINTEASLGAILVGSKFHNDQMIWKNPEFLLMIEDKKLNWQYHDGNESIISPGKTIVSDGKDHVVVFKYRQSSSTVQIDVDGNLETTQNINP